MRYRAASHQIEDFVATSDHYEDPLPVVVRLFALLDLVHEFKEQRHSCRQ